MKRTTFQAPTRAVINLKLRTSKTRLAVLFIVLLLTAIQPLWIKSAEAAPTSTLSSTIIFSDDFESNNLDKWTKTEATRGETVTTATYNPLEGRYHARFTTNGGAGTEHAALTTTLSRDDIFVSGSFYVARGLPLPNEDDRFYVLMLEANDQYITGIGVRVDNGQHKWTLFGRDGRSWIWPTPHTTPAIQTGKWYHIELSWTKSATSGKIVAYIDGQIAFELTNINTAYYGNIDTVKTGIVHATAIQNALIVYADTITLSTTTPTAPPPSPSPPSTLHDEYVVGWGGYIRTVNEVIPTLNDLVASGCNAIRYWARPAWYYGSGSDALNFEVLDLLVAEAGKRGVTVYIDCEHNYPPSAFITTNNRERWISDVIAVGLRYQYTTNVVVEPINEYTGTDQASLFNWGIQRIRAAGIHLPLLWNFWWNQPNVALIDPDNNYAIGRHLYGTSFDAYNPPTPLSLAQAVGQSTIDDAMYKYFDSTKETYYLQSVLRLNIPNGWVITEMGPTHTTNLVNNPGVGNMAYAMQFLREAVEHDVTVICFRIGAYSNKAILEQKAIAFFHEEYFIPPQ